MQLDDYTLAQLRDLTDATLLVAGASAAGIFQALRNAPATADELADRLAFDRRATGIVLRALVETGLVEQVDNRFAPSPRCARELCDPEGNDFVGRGLPHWLNSVRAATHIPEVLRRGGPLDRDSPDRTIDDVARFMAAMSAAPRERIERVVDFCLQRKSGAKSILDLGGGPGHMARAFIDRGLRATLFDVPDIVAHVADAYGLRDEPELDLVAGDFLTDDLPAGPFDIVLVSNVIHIYGPHEIQSLFHKVAGALEPGGLVAIVEFLRGRSPRAARFAVLMLLKTDAGNTYSFEEVGTWLQEAGFSHVSVDDLDEERNLVTAVRA